MNPRKQSRLITRSILVLSAGGYRCTRLHGEFGQFDIVAVSSTDVLLCKACEGKPPWTGAIAELQAVPGPPNCRKALHIWRSEDELPAYVEL